MQSYIKKSAMEIVNDKDRWDKDVRISGMPPQVKENGKTIYGRYCQQHHKARVDTPFGKQILENKMCEVCGWDKAPCDRHRENSEKGYTKTNVHILCPNCHRLVTLGLIEIKGNN